MERSQGKMSIWSGCTLTLHHPACPLSFNHMKYVSITQGGQGAMLKSGSKDKWKYLTLSDNSYLACHIWN